MKYGVAQDIAEALTLPSMVYTNGAEYQRQLSSIFARTWHFTPVRMGPPQQRNELALQDREFNLYLPHDIVPHTLLEGSLDASMVFTMDAEGGTSAVSNICTHRGYEMVREPCRQKTIQCGYHGALYQLNGDFRSMPDMDRPCDNLPRYNMGTFGPFVMASLDPAFDLDVLLKPVYDRVGFLPLDELLFQSVGPTIQAEFNPIQENSWIFTIDNYLDGRHIPFIHPGLNQTLDNKNYSYELFDLCNLQVGIARDDEPAFDLPQDHVDYGKNVGAYYFWLFPGTMLNFYPGGLSVNVVEPLAVDRTRTTFRSYIWDKSQLNSGASSNLTQVELEDRDAMKRLQKGARSPGFDRGKFSPQFDRAVHHFHRLYQEFMSS